jgi:NitT/TauT family transport system permease protein
VGIGQEAVRRLPLRDVRRRGAGGHRRRKVAERKEIGRLGQLAWGALGIVLVLVAWQVLSDRGVISSFIWSSPTKVWASARDLIDQGALWPACWQSLRLFLEGFAISAVSGIAIGIVLGWYRRPRALLDPWVSMLYVAPRVGLIPIIIAAFGIATKAQVIIVWSSAAFPIIVNVAVGVDTVDRDYMRVAQSFLGKNRDVLRGIAIPGSLPLLFSGMRQGVTAGLIGVVIAEYFIGNGGLGGLIVTASGSGQPGQAFVGAFIFAIFAVLMTSILHWSERRVSRWR